MDISGRILDVINGAFDKGLGHISVNTTDWGAQGVIYYRLKASAGIITKKMMIISQYFQKLHRNRAKRLFPKFL